MKRMIFPVLIISAVLFIAACNNNGKESNSSDPAQKQKTTAKSGDTTKPKHLVFVDSAALKKLRDSASIYSQLLDKFDEVDEQKYIQYYDKFEEVFLSPTGPTLADHNPLTFSIYEMYNNVQVPFAIHREQFTAGPTIYDNKIRIYPAIDPTQHFYLVLLRETQDMTTTPQPQPAYTDLTSNFIRIKNDVTTQLVLPADKTQAIADIKNFQAIWSGLGGTYYPCKSFSCNIHDYHELLGSTAGYWNVIADQGSATSNSYVSFFPVIDDDSDPSYKHLRLVVMLRKKNLLGKYVRVGSKFLFDNMDPCPPKCPDPGTEIN